MKSAPVTAGKPTIAEIVTDDPPARHMGRMGLCGRDPGVFDVLAPGSAPVPVPLRGADDSTRPTSLASDLRRMQL